MPLLVWIWPETPIAISVTVLLAIATHWLLRRAIGRGVEASVRHAEARYAGHGNRAERILAQAAGLTDARHAARTRAIGSILRSLTSVLVLVITVLTVMRIIEIPLDPVLASAGIGGVALGFGAQSLVKDYLSGIFMILEDQYGVGDLIDVGEVTGTVEEVGLRVTRIRDAGGQVWYVRNGEIVRVGNQSQGWSTGTVDVPVAPMSDAAQVIQVLQQVAAEVYADPDWEAVLLEVPTVAGVNSITSEAMVVRMFAKCAPNQHWGVQRDLLERSLAALRRAGVRGPLLGMGHAQPPTP